MSLDALLLLILAAGIHVTWNLIIKTRAMRLLVIWWALVLGGAVSLPLLWWYGGIPRTLLLFIGGSTLAEALYYILLIRAYERSDFSLVYPVARGFAPALLALWSLVFLGERPRAAGFAGIALVLAGIVIVGTGGVILRRGSGAARSVIAALAIGASTSVYSVVDAAAVRRFDPLLYMLTVFLATGLLITPAVIARYGARTALSGLGRMPLEVLAVAVLMPLGYVLVLHSYVLAPASYVGAIREISIVIAALIGWRWLGEGFGVLRLSGSVLMFCGILLLALAG